MRTRLGRKKGSVRSLGGVLRGSDKLNLHAVDSVHAVDEQNEDEDECDFHPVLDLRDNGVLGDESAVPSGLASWRYSLSLRGGNLT